MQLTDEDLQEFIKIYREEFNEEISVAEARETAGGLLELLLALIEAPPAPK